ncbi:MAG: class I SAM-dependent methyltransferase [Kordiimonadaceae bacterium]|nr:class I SAM-dependent methyltransferase [Kordiimonadaceae bacterium]
MSPDAPSYYSNINTELLDICPAADTVIEFGCGAGKFLEAYKTIHSSSTTVGFELFESAAKQAVSRCDDVIVGNAETDSVFEHDYKAEAFDLIIYGDVLEHFIDPWAALKKHLEYLKPGGCICACIPNVAHWSMIFELVNGAFEYKDAGLLDRTHLRLFTKKTIADMFTDAGLEIEVLKPRKFQTANTESAINTLAKMFDKPASEISPNRIEDWSTFQYLVRARKLT